MASFLVTGGAGFIGSNLVHRLVADDHEVTVLDALTYAGNLDNLESVADRIRFVHGDIGDKKLVAGLLADERPDAVLHLAAESHVDRSIDGPEAFVQANVVGTQHLLAATNAWWTDAGKPEGFRFVHVSTDEVYGQLGFDDPPFHEGTPYAPRSPYAASKAASDHFARAYHETFGLPVMITHCSNNYGPRQFPEKLIPAMITKACRGEPLTVYGQGTNVRDWLHVEDHADAIIRVATDGEPGEVYDIGGGHEAKNIDIVEGICTILDEQRPAEAPHADLITYVEDRLGHDLRYAIDASKIESELGWQPTWSFADGLGATVDWYLQNDHWVQRVVSGDYRSKPAWTVTA